MSLKIFVLFFLVFLISCSSDDIVKKEREEFYGIYRDLAKKSFADPTTDPSQSRQTKGIGKTRRWLSNFNQPIILISSTDFKNQATLIALGNNNEKLTWVSADGISLTFDQGVLIATRGFSQDLFSLRYTNPRKLFQSNKGRKRITKRKSRSSIQFK